MGIAVRARKLAFGRDAMRIDPDDGVRSGRLWRGPLGRQPPNSGRTTGSATPATAFTGMISTKTSRSKLCWRVGETRRVLGRHDRLRRFRFFPAGMDRNGRSFRGSLTLGKLAGTYSHGEHGRMAVGATRAFSTRLRRSRTEVPHFRGRRNLFSSGTLAPTGVAQPGDGRALDLMGGRPAPNGSTGVGRGTGSFLRLVRKPDLLHCRRAAAGQARLASVRDVSQGREASAVAGRGRQRRFLRQATSGRRRSRLRQSGVTAESRHGTCR